MTIAPRYVKPFSFFQRGLGAFFLLYSFWLLSNLFLESGFPPSVLRWGAAALFGVGLVAGSSYLALPFFRVGTPVDSRLQLFVTRFFYFLLLLVLSFHIRLSVIERVVVAGESMVPTIRPSDIVWIEKITTGIRLPDLSYPFGTLLPQKIPPDGLLLPARGDLVIFRYPGMSETPSDVFIKRVVALPGDRYEFQKNRVLVNGKPTQALFARGEESAFTELYEPPMHDFPPFLDQLAPEVKYSAFNGCGRKGTVPERTMLVLGDNLTRSRDSRSIGFIPLHFIIGRAIHIETTHSGDEKR